MYLAKNARFGFFVNFFYPAIVRGTLVARSVVGLISFVDVLLFIRGLFSTQIRRQLTSEQEGNIRPYVEMIQITMKNAEVRNPFRVSYSLEITTVWSYFVGPDGELWHPFLSCAKRSFRDLSIYLTLFVLPPCSCICIPYATVS